MLVNILGISNNGPRVFKMKVISIISETIMSNMVCRS
jgi:hypothetical protein